MVTIARNLRSSVAGARPRGRLDIAVGTWIRCQYALNTRGVSVQCCYCRVRTCVATTQITVHGSIKPPTPSLLHIQYLSSRAKFSFRHRGHRTGVHTGANSTPLEGPWTPFTCTAAVRVFKGLGLACSIKTSVARSGDPVGMDGRRRNAARASASAIVTGWEAP